MFYPPQPAAKLLSFMTAGLYRARSSRQMWKVIWVHWCQWFWVLTPTVAKYTDSLNSNSKLQCAKHEWQTVMVMLFPVTWRQAKMKVVWLKRCVQPVSVLSDRDHLQGKKLHSVTLLYNCECLCSSNRLICLLSSWLCRVNFTTSPS